MNTNDELDSIYYRPILKYDYSYWFEHIIPNNRTLSSADRAFFVAEFNKEINIYSSSLADIYEGLGEINNDVSAYGKINEVIYSVSLFIYFTMSDCLTANKYYLLAETDYDKRFMRGKMKVILNEGFKRLYGFNTNNKSEWRRLNEIIGYFPVIIKSDYHHITSLLEEQSKKSWWKRERDLETHLDASNLYKSRMEDINESEDMIAVASLLGVFHAINLFLLNLNSCNLNTLLMKYHKGELLNI